MRTLDLAGRWGLGLAPSSEEVGLLKYSDREGLWLTIPAGSLGSHTGIELMATRSRDDPAIITGLTQRGQWVLLRDVIQTRASLQIPGYPSQTYYANLGLASRDPIDPNPNVLECRVSLEHITEWVSDSFRAGPLPRRQAHSPFGAIRTGRHLGYESVVVMDDVAIGLCGQAHEHLNHASSAALAAPYELAVIPNEPMDFDTLHSKYIQPLIQFVEFCLNCGTTCKHILLRPVESRAWTEVFYQQRVPSESGEEKLPVSPLLPKKYIDDRLGTVLQLWLSATGDARRAMDQLVSLLDQDEPYLERRFLAAMNGLEAISRVTGPSHDMDPDAFQQYLAVVRKSISNVRVKDWALQRLSWANSPSVARLRERLAEHIGPYSTHLTPDRHRFDREINDSRNYYTHLDDRRNTNVLSGSGLFMATEAVLLLLRAAVLRYLDLSEDEVSQVMGACATTAQWTDRIARLYRV